MSVHDAELVARQAALLEEDLNDQTPMPDAMDTGVIAKRAAPRTHVADVEERIRAARVDLVMLTLHRRCTIPGTSWPSDRRERHRDDAEAVVSALFPKAGF